MTISGLLVTERVSSELQSQEFASLQVRRMAVSSAARSIAIAAASNESVVTRDGALNPLVRERFLLQDPELQGLATVIARADVRFRFGTWDEAQQQFTPLEDATFTIDSSGIEAAPGERRDLIDSGSEVVLLGGTETIGAVEVTLERPLSTRAARVAQVTGAI
ncbi:MAG: hypothetical protein ACKO8K_07195, partial [Candidatus Limnocylindrus sp.]